MSLVTDGWFLLIRLGAFGVSKSLKNPCWQDLAECPAIDGNILQKALGSL